MQFVDTHTHLYSEQFEQDRNEIILNAIQDGVDYFFLPNIDSNSIAGMKKLVRDYPRKIYAMIGLHPCSVNENVEEELAIIEKELTEENYVAIGEIGIDLYWDKSFIEQQKVAFRRQISWAKKYQLPIVIHCREAFDEILEILDEENDENLKGIFHCFTGSVEQAEHILSYGGFKLGIGGVVTFKNAGLDKVVAQLSLKDIVLETDAPYLAPAPYRGKRNESKYLLKVAEKVAEVYGISLSKVAKETTSNALEIFKI